MNINEIYIRNFGKLKDFKVTPTNGFNIVFGKNEAGKSTLLAFIKQMLYGGKDRKIYFPKDGSPCGGTLDFEYASKKYHLERTFGLTRKTDIINLKNAETGALIPIPLKQEPGEWIFDLTQEAFANTIYIGQLSSVFDSTKVGGSVVTKLSNLNSSGDEQLSYIKTDDRLRRAMNALSFRNKGKMHDLQDKIIALREEQNRLNISREIFEGKSKKINELKNSIDELVKQEENCKNYLKICEKKLFLKEFKEIDDLKLAVENQVNSSNNMDANQEREFLDTSKQLYNECAKDIAIIKKCEEDFNEQDQRCKLISQEYNAINDIIDIDFAKVEEIINIINSSEKAKTINQEKKSITPYIIELSVSGILALTCGIFSIKQYLMMIPTIVLAGLAFFFAFLIHKNKCAETEESDFREALNELADVLRTSKCNTTDELFKKKAEFDIYSSRISDIKDVRNSANRNLENSKQKLEDDQINLFNWLSKVAVVTSLQQAKNLIGKIELQSKEKYNADMQATVLSTKFETMLAGRTFQELEEKAVKISKYLLSIKNLNDFDESLLVECKGSVVEIENKIEEATLELSRIEGEVSVIAVEGKTTYSVEEEIVYNQNKLNEYEEYYSVLEIAKDALAVANEEMGSTFAPDINSEAAKILSDITGGKYNDVRISSSLEPVVFDKETGLLMEKWALSGGTIDQLYLSLRLAISAKMFELKEMLPLFLDEAFSQYDDERMAQTLKYLTSLNQQVLMFTCQEREINAIEDSDKVNLIKL